MTTLKGIIVALYTVVITVNLYIKPDITTAFIGMMLLVFMLTVFTVVENRPKKRE